MIAYKHKLNSAENIGDSWIKLKFLDGPIKQWQNLDVVTRLSATLHAEKKIKKKKNMIDTAHDAWKVKTDVISLISFLCVVNYQSYIIINSTWMLL